MTESSNDSVMLSPSTSPGALIKAAREKEGLHLAILSVNLKVNIKQLEALEADQFDKFSEAVFARALAAKVCRMVKLDSVRVLSLMPEATNGLKPLHLIDAEGHASFNGQGTERQRRASWGSTKFWALLVLISLLLLAVNNEWSEGIVGFKSNSTTLEMVPVMPPVQEPVAADAAQNDLPKAMVFESPSNAASGSTIIAPVSVPTEVKK